MNKKLIEHQFNQLNIEYKKLHNKWYSFTDKQKDSTEGWQVYQSMGNVIQKLIELRLKCKHPHQTMRISLEVVKLSLLQNALIHAPKTLPSVT